MSCWQTPVMPCSSLACLTAKGQASFVQGVIAKGKSASASRQDLSQGGVQLYLIIIGSNYERGMSFPVGTVRKHCPVLKHQ